jgi:hypothetical protein
MITTHSLQIYFVEKDHFIYKKGYDLVKQNHHEPRNTSNLQDNNDYGVVIFWQNNLVGNINIQLKQPNKLLESELFFGEQHWQPYFQANDFQITEISALTLSKQMPMCLRQGTIIALSLGVITLLNMLGIYLATTIQYKWLDRTLKKTLQLPFFENKIIQNPQANIPNDYYWQAQESPKIYYLNLTDPETIKTYSSFFCYLNYLGISTNFIPALTLTNSIERTYANFRQYVWQLDDFVVLLKPSAKLQSV